MPQKINRIYCLECTYILLDSTAIFNMEIFHNFNDFFLWQHYGTALKCMYKVFTGPFCYIFFEKYKREWLLPKVSKLKS